MKSEKPRKAGAPVKLPPTFFFVDNRAVPPDHPKSGIIAFTAYLLRRRDRERGRCSLPPYWSELADRLERSGGSPPREDFEEAERKGGHGGWGR